MASKDKSEMPLFIQGMYATVLGVSFYRIALQDKDNWILARSWTEVCSFFFSPTLGLFLISESFFRFLIFAFMVLIVAHDWYSYHSEKRQTEAQRSFWYYSPQILALVFIAQMFGAIEVLNLKYWYIFGFWYTICNTISISVNHEKNKGYLWYGVHAFVALVGFLLVPSSFVWPWYHVALGITVGIVGSLWYYFDKRLSTQNGSGDSEDAARDNKLVGSITSVLNKEIIKVTDQINAQAKEYMREFTKIHEEIQSLKLPTPKQ